jgi:hemoglobin-like flavoprotein
MLRENWDSLVKAETAESRTENIKDVGVAIFHNLFAMAPPTRDLFKFSAARSGGADYSEKLRRHAGVAFTAVDGLIAQLDSPEQTVATLREVCSGHLKYRVQEPHYKMLLSAIVKTLGDALPAKSWQQSQQEAWGALAGAILGVVHQVYVAQEQAAPAQRSEV